MGNKLTIDKRAFKSPPDGFTLIEVLAGILIATAFVLITSQAIAISALYRVRAQRESLAWLWIQENFEDDIKLEASQLPYVEAQCGTLDENGQYVQANASQGYAQALIKKITGATVVPSIKNDYKPELLNKEHTATRTLNIKSPVTDISTDSFERPYNVMTVSYEVRDPDMGTVENANGTVIASFYTEVTPDAAFLCK